MLALLGATFADRQPRRQADEIRRVTVQAAGATWRRAPKSCRATSSVAPWRLSNTLLERLGQRFQGEAERDALQGAITRLLEEVSGVAEGH